MKADFGGKIKIHSLIYLELHNSIHVNSDRLNSLYIDISDISGPYLFSNQLDAEKKLIDYIVNRINQEYFYKFISKINDEGIDTSQHIEPSIKNINDIIKQNKYILNLNYIVKIYKEIIDKDKATFDYKIEVITL
jgi:hypothetical protein